jgi:hypothetical protein
MAETSLENGQVVAARYTLLRKLGAGRDAEVWLARDEVSGRERAIKLPDPSADRASFARSVRAQHSIEHPNVLRCDDVGDDAVPYATFEYFPRGDLSRLRGRAWQELVPILGGVAAGAAALHAAGIVHRDLKPANVLLTDDGTPKLADLGLAAAMGADDAVGGGSPFSASPEQLGGAAASVADDVYGFGALCYELISGYPPYYPDAEARTRGDSLPPLRAANPIPPALADLVTSCLSVDPAARPAEFASIRSALRAIATDPGIASEPGQKGFALQPPQEPLARIEPRWQRERASAPDPSALRAQGFRRGLVAAGFVVLLLGAGFVFVGLPRWTQHPVPVTKEPVAPPPAAVPVPPAPVPAAPPWNPAPVLSCCLPGARDGAATMKSAWTKAMARNGP